MLAPQVHYRTHTDEKPILCELCDFACRQRASLQWHMKKRHPSAVGIAPGGEPAGIEELSEFNSSHVVCRSNSKFVRLVLLFVSL